MHVGLRPYIVNTGSCYWQLDEQSILDIRQVFVLVSFRIRPIAQCRMHAGTLIEAALLFIRPIHTIHMFLAMHISVLG